MAASADSWDMALNLQTFDSILSKLLFWTFKMNTTSSSQMLLTHQYRDYDFIWQMLYKSVAGLSI